MFDIPQIPLFPFDSTSITVTTTVWIGVLISAFFNLRFGWTLSALVVPGYVVPLLMSRPTTAVVILAEGIVTYAIAIAISEANRNRPYWSSLFGRDRFFLIVVVSILVRAIADGWLLPTGGRWLVEHYNVDLDYRNELGSFGLIAVALLANYFWKPGLRSGLLTLSTCVGLTWAAVAWVLVPYTNFNVGSFHFLYEDISVSMLASPKAYVIILVTGWFASWMNLRYSWDFSGILIPALIAMLWAEPERILFSLCEAGLVLAIGKLLLTATPLRNVAMQGGRKLAFYFTVCFVFRFAMAHTLSQFAPEIKVTDFFGMGYLLSTLVAIKIEEKRMPLRIAGGILKVSAVGAVGACLIGFALNWIGVSSQTTPVSAAATTASQVQHTDLSIADLYQKEKLRLYRDLDDSPNASTDAAQLKVFGEALRKLKSFKSTGQSSLTQLANEFAQANYELWVVQEKQFLLRERDPFQRRGWFVISADADQDICVIAERAVAEKWTGDAAIFLSHQLAAKSLAISEMFNQRQRDHQRTGSRSPFVEVFQKTFTGGSLLLRTGSNSSSNRLLVEGDLPQGLNMPLLKRLAGGFQIRWDAKPSTQQATLFVTPDAGQKMAIDSTKDRTEQSLQIAAPLPATLDSTLNSILENVCEAATDQYRTPKQEELLFIETAILKPLFSLASQAADDASLLKSLTAINHEAESVGYRVQLLHDRDRDEKLIVFREKINPNRRLGWGSVLFRCGLTIPTSIEVPRPKHERQTFEFAANLYANRVASVLLVAGSRPDTNRDGSSDLSRSANRSNLMNLCRHVLLQELRNRPWLTLQARAMQSYPAADIAIATSHGSPTKLALSPNQKHICETLSDSGLTLAHVDGRKEFAGYEVSSRLTDIADATSANKETISLWLSPKLRDAYRSQDPQNNLSEKLQACGLVSRFNTRADLIAASASVDANRGRELPSTLRKQLLEFCQSHDVVQLYATIKQHERFALEQFYDRKTGSTLIAVVDESEKMIALINPRGLRDRMAAVNEINATNLQKFFLSRSLIMEVN